MTHDKSPARSETKMKFDLTHKDQVIAASGAIQALHDAGYEVKPEAAPAGEPFDPTQAVDGDQSWDSWRNQAPKTAEAAPEVEPDKSKGYECANGCVDFLYWSESDKKWVHERTNLAYCDHGGESYEVGIPLIPAKAEAAQEIAGGPDVPNEAIEYAHKLHKAAERITGVDPFGDSGVWLRAREPKPSPQAEAVEHKNGWHYGYITCSCGWAWDSRNKLTGTMATQHGLRMFEKHLSEFQPSSLAGTFEDSMRLIFGVAYTYDPGKNAPKLLAAYVDVAQKLSITDEQMRRLREDVDPPNIAPTTAKQSQPVIESLVTPVIPDEIVDLYAAKQAGVTSDFAREVKQYREQFRKAQKERG